MLLLVLIGVITYTSYPKYIESKQCKEVSISFINSIVNGDLETAKSKSRGKILWQLANADNLPQAKTDYIDAKVTYLHSNIAKTLVVCELDSSAGKDVGWYELFLLKDAGEWKVYKIAETVAEPPVINIKRSTAPVAEAEDTIQKFIIAVASGQNANQYLAGPARKSYEQVPAGITKEIPRDINVMPLCNDDKTAIYRAKYTIDNRQIMVVVSLYKLDIWKIVSISQL